MNNTKKLTEGETWDEIWQNLKLPQTIQDPYYPRYWVSILDDFFKKYLPKKKNLDFIELGCAPGRWLHYFYSEFGYKVSGLDNSPVGLKVTKKNLRLLGVNADLYFGDILNYKINKKFDVVFSMGLVEHFDPLTGIIEAHMNLVNEKGHVIIGIPNLKYSLYYFLQKAINSKPLKHHLLLDKKELLTFFDNRNVITHQYLGVFNLYLLNLSQRSLICKIIYCMEILIEKILRLANIKIESQFFSPYIFIITKK